MILTLVNSNHRHLFIYFLFFFFIPVWSRRSENRPAWQVFNFSYSSTPRLSSWPPLALRVKFCPIGPSLLSKLGRFSVHFVSRKGGYMFCRLFLQAKIK